MSNAQDIPVWEKYTLTIEEASKWLRRHHTPTFPQTCRDVPDGAATMDIKFGRTVRGAIVLMEHLASIAWYFRKWIWLLQLLLKKRMEAEFSL